jgi:hypothetical protein
MVTCITSVFFFLAWAAVSSGGDSITSASENNPAKSQIKDEIKPLRGNQVRNDETMEEMYQGLLIHTNLGTIKIYFTPELSGTTSIEYIQKVVLEATKNKAAA